MTTRKRTAKAVDSVRARTVVRLPKRQGFTGASYKASRSPVISNHPDAKLICLCIEYGTLIAGAQVAYNIDPTDSEFASQADSLTQTRADRAMLEIIDLETKTMDGLRAKAAIVKIAIEDWACDLEEIRQDFLVSLANDAIRLQRAGAELKRSAAAVG